MIEKCVNFIASGFWQAILFIVIVGLFFNILNGILRFIFGDGKFENTPFIRRIIYNIFLWGPFIAAFFTIWHIRQGKGWLVFGIISVIIFAASFLGSIIAANTDRNNKENNISGFGRNEK